MLVLTMTRLAMILLLAGRPVFAQPKEALVPMRDGAQLATDLYFPSGPSNGLPVVLERTPYNKSIVGRRAEFWTARGYVYAIQDVRGRFRSEGRFEPFLREGSDGFDTIEWLALQPWCSGKVGTIGGSYDALVQWQAAVEQPPHLAALLVKVPLTDNFPYNGSVMDFWGLMHWLKIIPRQSRRTVRRYQLYKASLGSSRRCSMTCRSPDRT